MFKLNVFLIKFLPYLYTVRVMVEPVLDNFANSQEKTFVGVTF